MASGDLTVYQGARLIVVFDVTDDAGAPFPLTASNYTAAALQARTRRGVTSTLVDVSTASGELTIEPGGATGQVHLDVGANLTVELTVGGPYDCLAWNPADPTDVIVIASGQIIVKKRVTQKP